MRRFIFYIVLLAVFLLAPFWAVVRRDSPDAAEPSAPTPTAAAQAAARPYRAVWVSYLEWQQVDFSAPSAYTRTVEEMLDNIASLGATVVLAQVRPFGDALYPSRYYPFSHLCTGVQGQDPGFDPLALLLAAAHARGLEVEAWINPYRLQAGQVPTLCETSPARLHPEWVKYTANGAYLNPADAAVRQYIADAVGELCANYPLDGIHFDDYFYPTADPAFDAADYAQSGTALTQDDWRRENVNLLMELCHETSGRYGVQFGAAPAGSPEQNYTLQYSDAARWLRQGTVDYLMPQLYHGLEYQKDGSTARSLARLAAAWAALPRAAGVELYAGLGAYRIGAGDGSDAGSEWFGGHALADQLAALETLGIEGAGLYRYASLFDNPDAPALAGAEAAAVTQYWAESDNSD